VLERTAQLGAIVGHGLLLPLDFMRASSVSTYSPLGKRP
jgi:hypothetical protein